MVNQIAAGEVVIQPCSVLKELIENSIDAGATKIDVQFYGSGADQLEVHDNGMGMNAEDLQLCIEPHATSKITSVEDLYQVMSCGFRGEALASIAEVSSFEITSKTDSTENATIISNKSGKIEISDAARGNGTSVVIKNLFHNVPVRRRFLKSDRAETGNNLDILRKLAISRPWVGISVKHDDKICFECDEDQSLAERTKTLDVFEKKSEFLEIDYERDNIKVTGICVAPPQHYGNAKKIQLYINRRPIKDKALTQAFVKAYSSYIPERRYPGAIIFLEMPANDVDVNIHPTKSEVRFHRSEDVFKVLYASIRNVLVDSAQVEDACESTPLVYKKSGMIRTVPMNRSYGGIHEKGEQKPFLEKSFLEPEKAYSSYSSSDSSHQAQNFANNSQNEQAVPEPPLAEETEMVKSFSVDSMPNCFQLLNRFIVVEADDHFEIMDQHAVHERVLFNQLHYDQTDKKFETQQLLAPTSLPYPTELHEISDDVKSDFESMGYELDWQEENATLLIQGIPDFLSASKATIILEEILNELIDGVLPQKDDLKKHILHSTACRAAIKAGDALSTEELHNIVAATLSMDDTQGCCPHGRNSSWRISIEEANTMFNR